MHIQPAKHLPRGATAVFVVVFAAAVIVASSCAPPASKSHAVTISRWPDSIRPGFYNPPRGVKPINHVVAIKHARPSYAWLVRGKKRMLVEFATSIQHVVVIYMENRTPEDLFAGFFSVLNPSTGNLFGADLDLEEPSTISPLPSAESLQYGQDPGHKHWHDFYDEATKDKWPTYSPNSGYWYVPSPTAPASSGTNNYIMLIEQFAYANHVLQSNEGPSFVAHQYAIAGQSGGLPDSNIAENGITENPPNGSGTPPGDGDCYDTPSTTMVDMYTAYPTPPATPHGTASPETCNEYPTIFDALMTAQPSPVPTDDVWQYVADDKESIWAAPMAVQHLYDAYSSASDVGSQPFAVDADAKNFILNATLSTSPSPSPYRPFAYLTYLTPCLGESDHPNTSALWPSPHQSAYDDGPDWLAYIVDALGGSTYWANTAIIVTWDDWGGFYDNFSPTPWPYHTASNPYGGNLQDPNEWGFRVPLMVISPYAISGYIYTPLMSQGAILNFIESVFSLPTHVVGADDLANGNQNLMAMFNFSQTPLPGPTIPSNFTPDSGAAACPPPTPTP
jgi:phospholipase C